MNETMPSQEEKSRCVINQAMQIETSSSPNDVRALFSEDEASLRPKVAVPVVGGRRASYAGSESIKIIPTEQSLVEQQLCENEARAFDREYAMYQRILCGRAVFEHNRTTSNRTSSSFPYLTNCSRDVTSQRYVSSNAIDNGYHHVPKTVYPSAEKDTIVNMLQFNIFTGLPDPTDVSYYIPPSFDVVDNNDDGVFDLEM